MFNCILCQSNKVKFLFKYHDEREFYHCEECDLKFVDRKSVLSLKDQKEVYDLHQNNIRSSGYEKFLMRVVDPIRKLLPDSSRGLDFGCGPYPMLIEIFNDYGYENIYGYDPIYKNQVSLLENRYDFITCCEVIEHFINLKSDLDQLLECIVDSGILVLSTGLHHEAKREFKEWHYIQDITHINFFSKSTCEYIAKTFDLSILDLGNDIITLQKR